VSNRPLALFHLAVYRGRQRPPALIRNYSLTRRTYSGCKREKVDACGHRAAWRPGFQCQHFRKLVVALRRAVLHAAVNDGVANRLQRVEHGGREYRLVSLLDQDGGYQRLTRVVIFLSSLRASTKGSLSSLADFLRCQVLLMRCQRPTVSERIGYQPVAIAPEHVS
jgi:hypothetical protein